MASCPDSDNSWVLAGPEVGEAGLGARGGGIPVGPLSGSGGPLLPAPATGRGALVLGAGDQAPRTMPGKQGTPGAS